MLTRETAGSSMSCGRSVRMRVTASRTSESATSTSFSSSNSITVTDEPSLIVEMILSMSGSVATVSSTLRVTSVSSCDGVAPA
jgi:hypothetical protein